MNEPQKQPSTLNEAIANQNYFIPLKDLSPPAEAPSATIHH